MARGKRTTIAPNIRVFPNGVFEARVSVTGLVPRIKRFPPGTSVAHMTGWVEAARDQMADEIKAFGELPPAARARGVGTLEGDAPAFFRQIAGRASSKADMSHLRAWFEVVVEGVRLGALPRTALATKHINEAIAQWQTLPSPHAVRRIRVGGHAREAYDVVSFARAGTKTGVVAAHAHPAFTVPAHTRAAPATSGAVVSALTIRHRCRVLADLYHTLDGKQARTPVDDAKIPKRPKTPPSTLPPARITAVLETLATTDPVTFARFYVAATTGQRPCQIGRARPDDLQLDATPKIWLVRNAKGEPAHCIVLNPQQVAAWEAFIAANAWGAIDTSKYGRIIHAAGWPIGLRPYAARHSLAADAIRRGISLGDVQALLGHADPTTTRIYAPFQIDRQVVVSGLMAPYLADVLKPRLVKK